MANDVTWFSLEILPEGWFAPELKPDGWFGNEFLDSSAAINATGNGTTLTYTYSFIAGSASGGGAMDATANGITFSYGLSLLSGSASASSQASGVVLSHSYSLLSGSAQASSQANGIVLPYAFSLLAGSASGQANATANGAILTVALSLQAGTASAQQPDTGQTGGFAIIRNRRARIDLKPVTARALALKGRYFAKTIERRIDLELPEQRELTVANVAAQPMPQFRSICHPVIDKSVVIEKRNRQIEKMLKAAHSHMIDEFLRHVETL